MSKGVGEFLLNLLCKKGDFEDSLNGYRKGWLGETEMKTEVFSKNENFMGIATISSSVPKPFLPLLIIQTLISSTTPTTHILSCRTLEAPSSETQKDPRKVTFSS